MLTTAIIVLVSSVVIVIIGAACAFSAMNKFHDVDGFPIRFFVSWVFNLLGGLGVTVGIILLIFALVENYS